MSIKMRMPPLASVRGQTLLTDTKPYLFRQSPIESQMLDLSLTGGTVAWNQQAQLGAGVVNAATRSYDSTTGVTTVTPTNYASNNTGCYNLVPAADLKAHKYLCTIMVDTDNTANFQFGFGSNITIQQVTSGAYRTLAHVFSWTASSLTLYARAGEAGWSSGTFRFKNVQAFDLTQMFGSTIADYVYTLEQSTTGSGIAWLKSFVFFTEDYYPYDSGSLLSVKTSGHKTVGKNLLKNDGSQSHVTLGITYTKNADGKVSATGTASGLANYAVGNVYNIAGETVRLLAVDGGGAAYRMRAVARNANGTALFVDGAVFQDAYNGVDRVFTAPSNTEYIQVYCSITSGTYNGLVFEPMLTLNTGTATPYEPYKEHVYPLDNDLELRGIPKLTDGQMYYDGDTYKSDGTVTRKYGIRAYQAGDESLADAVTDGTNTVYKLVAPTTETTDTFTNPQQAGSTEEYIDERTVPMPVGHTTEYFNMEQKEQIQMHMPTHSPIKMHMEG